MTKKEMSQIFSDALHTPVTVETDGKTLTVHSNLLHAVMEEGEITVLDAHTFGDFCTRLKIYTSLKKVLEDTWDEYFFQIRAFMETGGNFTAADARKLATVKRYSFEEIIEMIRDAAKNGYMQMTVADGIPDDDAKRCLLARGFWYDTHVEDRVCCTISWGDEHDDNP